MLSIDSIKYTVRYACFAAISIIIALVCFACRQSAPSVSGSAIPDTLRVGTLYGPTSYFLYRDQPMGYEYELMQKVLEENGVGMKIEVAPGMDSLIAMLNDNRIDVIAFEVPYTAQFNDRVLHCGNENITYQVLVQPASESPVRNATDLIGKEVWVIENSKYEHRLRNLNNEVGGGIIIRTVPQDSIIADDLIEMVSNGTIPLTVIDSDKARINRTYYPNIDISTRLGFPQRSSWAVRNGNTELADSLTSWVVSTDEEATAKALLKRYFETQKNNGILDFSSILKRDDGAASPYDDLFRKYAEEYGRDWRAVAAQGYVESKFRPNARSWAGARGVMQIMPGTARQYGLPLRKINDPESNIRTSVKIIDNLDRVLTPYVPDANERRLFVSAAYNGGLGHVLDAINLAKKYGKDPQVWYGNVEAALQMKSNPLYYNDEVCRFGYFKGKETLAYVSEVEKIYDIYRHKLPK